MFTLSHILRIAEQTSGLFHYVFLAIGLSRLESSFWNPDLVVLNTDKDSNFTHLSMNTSQDSSQNESTVKEAVLAFVLMVEWYILWFEIIYLKYL